MLDDICAVFAASGQPLLSLEGRKILVDVNGKLLAATAKGRDGAPPVFVNTKSGRGRRGDGPPSPPPSLKRKFRFLSDAIELTEPTQRAFERAGLLRGYDPLDVLGALKGALGAKASDLQRQEALVWSFKVWNGGGGKPVEQALRAADLSVPTLGGWHRARTALFSGTWTSLGRTVEQYLLEAAPASPDCAKVRDRLLIGFGEWPRAGADDRRDDWFRFLRLLGTSDGLPPLAAAIRRKGTPRAYWHGVLSTHCAENGLGPAWTARVSATRFENPYTDYELGGEIWRLPGQTEHAQLSADARAALSDLIIAFLREHGDKHFRFSIDHYRRFNRAELPTPLAVFLGTGPWVASTRGDDIVFAAAFGSKEFAAVDHGGGQRPVRNERAVVWTPGCAELLFEQVDGSVPHEFGGVAALDQRQALREKVLQFDRADFGAVLLTLAGLLLALAVKGPRAGRKAHSQPEQRLDPFARDHRVVSSAKPDGMASTAPIARRGGLRSPKGADRVQARLDPSRQGRPIQA